MPTILTEVPELTLCDQPPHKRWTREEVECLEVSGLLEGQHYELIDGELINKMGKKRPHTNTLIVVQGWLLRVFGEQYVNPETSIDVALEDKRVNEPEPDLIVLNKPSREIRDSNPQPDDIRLAVEISDSTVRFDLKRKAELYARAGVPEYWVFDIPGRRLIVHRDPREGRYQSITAYADHENVRPLAAPDQEFRVGEAFL